tara:strand:+ start:288 stop:677 length:390 start_codon:yes stop_codon:yes gene_type:complete
MKKGTKLYSILNLKCPRCQKGDLFLSKGWIVFKQMLYMPKQCHFCGQSFRIEPGFYTAALWVSYPIVLIVFIPLIVLGFSLKNLSMFFTIIYPGIVILCFLFQIPLMRFTREILINMHVDFDNHFYNPK